MPLVPCYSPLKGHRTVGGKVTFKRLDGYTGPGMTVEVKCGQCIGCRISRARDWALRCSHEAQLHQRNSFLTLTYDQVNLPADGGLVLAHWQDFAKRARKRFGAFRFYHCGEYGEHTQRAHYHALIFGQDWAHDRLPIPGGKHQLWDSSSLRECWGHGHVSIGVLNSTTAAYVCKYALKGDKRKPYEHVNEATGEVTKLKQPYATMSRRPGLGSGWIEQFKSDVFPDDFVVSEGRKNPTPRFYDQTLTDEELLLVKQARRATGLSRASHNTLDRRQAGEAIATARSALKARSGQ